MAQQGWLGTHVALLSLLCSAGSMARSEAGAVTVPGAGLRWRSDLTLDCRSRRREAEASAVCRAIVLPQGQSLVLRLSRWVWGEAEAGPLPWRSQWSHRDHK